VRATLVRSEAVQRGEIRQTLAYSGEIRAREEISDAGTWQRPYLTNRDAIGHLDQRNGRPPAT
jgi:hypothetical protein